MALLNDIKKMQTEGKTEQEIISELRKKGVSAREIIDVLSQSKIKEAVSGGQEAPAPQATSQPAPAPQATPTPQAAPARTVQQDALMPPPSQQAPAPQAAPAQAVQQEAQAPQQQEMQPSQQMTQEYVPSQPAQAEQPIQYQDQQAQYPQTAYPEGQQYPQQGGISPDTISEISEQVVSEKLAPLRKNMEKVLDLKTTIESRMESIDERLKRIEKIIDRLNLSIMQKVGDYMTNINDIKKELIETQKSFKARSPKPNSPAPQISQKEKPKKIIKSK